MTASPETTIAIVPRETFSHTRRCVENTLRVLEPGTRVVCIDGGAPRSVRRYLEAAAREHDLVLLRTDRFLSPNEARNLALPYVTTEYVLFMDYETVLPLGVVEKLELRARATGAWAVGTTVIERIGTRSFVHMAGGENHVVETGTRRWLRDSHRYGGRALADLPPIAAEATEQVEFHCMLVRRDVFDQLGPLDERLLSLREHLDLCLQVHQHGGRVWLEPDVAVTYQVPRWPKASDRGYWLVRWSDAWNRASIDHFSSKWCLSDDDPEDEAALCWADAHRRFCYRPYLSVLSRCFGSRRRAVYDWVDPRAQRVALGRHTARSSRADAPRLVHAASWLSSALRHD